MPAERRDRRAPRDWAEIRRRVEAAGRAISGELRLSSEQVRRLLEERARGLARPLAQPPAGEALEVITFSLAEESFAIETRSVVEVFRLGGLTLLPGVEPPACGLTAWRGELLTLFDLRLPLGLGAGGLSGFRHVLVLGEERAAFGILVDAVQDLIRIPLSEVRSLPEGARAQREYLRGITAEAVLVLEGAQLLRTYS